MNVKVYGAFINGQKITHEIFDSEPTDLTYIDSFPEITEPEQLRVVAEARFNSQPRNNNIIELTYNNVTVQAIIKDIEMRIAKPSMALIEYPYKAVEYIHQLFPRKYHGIYL